MNKKKQTDQIDVKFDIEQRQEYDHFNCHD